MCCEADYLYFHDVHIQATINIKVFVFVVLKA